MAPLPPSDTRPFLGTQQTYIVNPETHSIQPIPPNALTISIRYPSADDPAIQRFLSRIPDPVQFLSQQYTKIRAILGIESPVRYRNITLAFTHADGLAHTQGDTITLSLPWIASWSTRRVDEATHEFQGVITHELVHVMQYDGAGTAAWWWIEGVADYVRLVLGLAPREWGKRGEGGSYVDGYGVTALWLEWICERSCARGLVQDVNARLAREEWREEWVEEVTGLSTGTLWEIYKAQHAN